MAESVYGLCILASGLIAALLLRGYRHSRQRLLLWIGVGFVLLCLNNIFVAIDLALGARTDLSLVRNVITLAGGACVVFGLVWEQD